MRVSRAEVSSRNPMIDVEELSLFHAVVSSSLQCARLKLIRSLAHLERLFI